jgi:flagellar biosynthesis protein FliQ
MDMSEMTQVIDWSREGLKMALLLGGPLLAVALVVAVLAAVLIALPWMIGRWVAYAAELFGSIPDRM